MTPLDTQFVPTIKELIESLSKHIKEEESEHFPKVKEALP
jgi:hypothetical protein